MLYGAGETKLGLFALGDWRRALREGVTDKPAPELDYAKALGADAKGQLLKGMPALEMLLTKVHAAHKRGYIRGLDGRILACKSEHGALNDLLQSDGAIVMKHALVNFWAAYRESHGRDWAFMLNVHDEWQAEARPELAEELGTEMVQAIRQAGEDLRVRCPLDGSYKIGTTWKETH
jgi:DNA polymerase-1